MNKRQACFVCTTPYQLLGAIGITQSENLEADVYIFGMFPGYETVARKLNEHGIFEHVYAVDSDDVRSPGRKRAFLQMVFANKTVASFLPENTCYEYYYSTSRAHIKTILQSVLLKRNPEMRTVIYEDGMGTYFGGSHVLKTTKLKAIAESILGWHLFDPKTTRMMAFIPELVDVPDALKGSAVEAQPRIIWNEKTLSVLNDVFSVNNEDAIDAKCIIFDTLRGLKNLDEKDLAVLDACYNIIVETVGDSNVLCKPHPRSTAITGAGVTIYEKQGIPMEILYAGMSRLSDRILVTYTSTAVFAPKIFFDQEPTVICLHRCLKETNGSQIFESIYSKFRNTYTDTNRVYAPTSQDELSAIMKKLCSE